MVELVKDRKGHVSSDFLKYRNHCLEMTHNLMDAFENKEFFDVTVKCGDVSFKCNKFTLTARSPVFKVRNSDFSPKLVRILYTFSSKTRKIKIYAFKL